MEEDARTRPFDVAGDVGLAGPEHQPGHMWWAGHPPSCVYRCHSDVIPRMSEHLRSLGPRHHAAIRLKLDGASGSEIADALGVETRTVYLWMGDPWSRTSSPDSLTASGMSSPGSCALAASTALAELRKMAELPVDGPLTVSEKLAFIRAILDRYSELEHAR